MFYLMCVLLIRKIKRRLGALKFLKLRFSAVMTLFSALKINFFDFRIMIREKKQKNFAYLMNSLYIL